MSNDIPEFREKEFLLFLLKEYEKRYGSSVRFLDTHYFYPHVNKEMEETFPDLVSINGGVKSTKFFEWFKEARARGILKNPDEKQDYNKYFLTEYGYSKALRNKNPIKWFFQDHWQWVLGIMLTIFNLIAAGIRLALEVGK